MATLLVKRTFFLGILCSAIFLSNCTKEENEPIVDTKDGLFVLCEGNFNWGNASVTYFSGASNELRQDYFHEVNDYNLGDIAQSFYETDEHYFIVVNNSSKIEVLNRSDFSVSTTITGLGSPRYMESINDSIAYVTDLWNNKIHIINYINGTILDFIPVSGWAEQMVSIEDSVYVSLYNEESIGVIDRNTHSFVAEIELDLPPIGVRKDKNGKLWVTASEFGGQSKLYKIDSESREIEATITFEADESLSYIDNFENSNHIYLVTSLGNIYKMNINAESLPNVLFNVELEGLYGLTVKEEGSIFICEAFDFVQNGRVTKYDDEGTMKFSIASGVGPNNIIFR